MPDDLTVPVDALPGAEQLAGVAFTEAERALMLPGVARLRRRYEALRAAPLPNSVAPALAFEPRSVTPRPPTPPAAPQPVSLPPAADLAPTDLPFASVAQLAALLRARKVSSLELTELFLARVARHDPQLACVVTLTADLARAQARRADAELAAGRDRGPLHGIPWGAKDLLATRGIPTTWGAAPFRDQVFDDDATVVARLEAAGAVLLAKLTLGELAWGDVWFGGQTKNPWDLTQGSSGSSAGSAAAVAAGLAPFAIGSETHGSIVSPSTVCGVTGLRPTFGRVSRHGAMALSWTMDKLGPMCRTAADCALVFQAIYGPDGQDPTVADAPFAWAPRDSLRGLRIGVVAGGAEAGPPDDDAPVSPANDRAALDVLRDLGAELVPIALPDGPIDALQTILEAEAAAAFDELTRGGRDDELVRQIEDAWPNVLRRSRLIPAVEYIQANRVRAQLMHAMDRLMRTVDLYVAPSFGPSLLLTNLTGHPAVVLPSGLTARGWPTSITLTGRLDDEATILAAADAYQRATGHHLLRPPGF